MNRFQLGTCALLLAVGTPVLAASLPEQGQSMQSVEQQYGSPLQKYAAVGKPPITRWEYDNFAVVFERKSVVHSFNVQRSAPAASTTKPATP